MSAYDEWSEQDDVVRVMIGISQQTVGSAQSAQRQGFEGGRQWQRRADATLIEAAGCICRYLVRLAELEDELSGRYDPFLVAMSVVVGMDYRTDPPTVTKHAPCCPAYLGEQIRSQS